MGNLVVKITEVTKLVVVAVAVMVVVTATPTRDNLGSSSSLDMVAGHLDNLDTRGTLEAILMVVGLPSSSMAEVVVVPEDVVAEEGPQQDRSFVTGAEKWVTSPLSAKRLW